MGLSVVKASNGSGEAVSATVTQMRSPGSTVLKVSSLTNWPQNFIVTSGKKIVVNNQTVIDPTTITVFFGHKDGADIAIDGYAPGYTDKGHPQNYTVIIKPTTYWADQVGGALITTHNDDGTLKTSAVQAALNQSGAVPPDWTVLANAPTSVVYNGQKNYTVGINGVDYTDRIQPGTRIRTARTVAAPTRSTLLNGTNQYWNRSTVNGMSFTDDFVVGAWIKLSNYADCTILSRYNGTSGWRFHLEPDGRISMAGFNGGSGNFSQVTSYQSVPLNKWVHVAAQLDMSAFTATTTTSYVTFYGIDIACSLFRAGSNPTSLVQAGSLEVGSINGGTTLFPGAIAQAFVTSAKLTQDQVRAIQNQGIAASDIANYNIVSAYNFDNNANDINTTNGNSLTSQNGAAATNLDSPFGGQGNGNINSTIDYGIVMSSAVSNGNTLLTVQTPEGCTIPTTGGVSAISYSSIKSPFGMSIVEDKWVLGAYNRTDTVFGVGSAAQYYYAFPALSLLTPVGNWKITNALNIEYQGTSAGTILGRSAITTEIIQPFAAAASTLENGNGLWLNKTGLRYGGATNSTALNVASRSEENVLLKNAARYSLVVRQESGGGGYSVRHFGMTVGNIGFIEARNLYL